ncbi:MAG: hypothetical protein K8T10_00710 [Candidatus Eremiobacteraeota bacterium]|nr:hypothetical protein [Candidatus Eremiobacteraeota bacterium]
MSLSFLRRNLGLKIFSIILAIFLWAYVKYTQAPYSVASQAKVEVPITLEGKNEKFVALDLPEGVSLTVKGNQDTISSLDTSHFKAYVDLHGKEAGQHHLKIKINTPPGIDVNSVKIVPETVLLKLDPIVKQVVNVKVKPRGAIASGFILDILTSDPESVTVKGAQTIVSKVKEVQAVCDVEGADMDKVQQVEVEAVDEGGKVIDSVTVEPDFVRATIKLKSEVTTSHIQINPSFKGSPAKGYQVKEVTVKPPVASVKYPYDMKTPPKSIKTKPINIEGAKQDIEKEIPIVAPKDVVVSPEKVIVKIGIGKIVLDKNRKNKSK